MQLGGTNLGGLGVTGTAGASGTAGVSGAVGPAGAAGVAGAATAAGQVTPQPRLVRAAHEFEAQMMKELLKPLTSGDSLTGDGDSSSAGSTGALGEYASEALGRALSDQGGFGIANRIVKELSPSGNQTGPRQVTRDLHGDTVMRSLK